ncbi:uncharacterized protein BHQ10_007542 [Talaromyces amestolkiae]|uniref:Uncharacterized protein n=1 Tax=Talaromyces amestolkiae TaxID=1196081 RepID=A0A364L6T2_TALAM|nr:uncharacterized protein BHQ10_007542 [Talaromyces amestolkiae]RAO71530.1 hypothetical protein BHQ10_007542 [Talaromyces amestolkiae]
MEALVKHHPLWNSLPTTFPRSQTASSLRDSSCPSDDVSDISLGTINTALTNISTTLPDFGIPIPHTPKQHFKFQNSAHNLSGTDFGYESDDSRVEAAEHVEFSERAFQYPEDALQGDEIFAFEDYSYDHFENATSPYDPCDSASEFDDFEDFDDIDEALDGYANDLQFDDSHIAFENFVRFDADVSYIDAVELPDEEINDEIEEAPQMTLHEMMLLTDRHRGLAAHDNQDTDEDSVNEETSIANVIIEELAKDYPRDMLEVDRQLFIAFVNGIHGDTRRKYQSCLHDRVQGFREGRFLSPFFEGETDSAGCFLLDEALKHVIGMFRHIVLREEFDELVRLAQASRMQEKMPTSLQMQPSTFLNRVEGLLSERLLDGIASIGKDELSFFADGVVYALEHPKIYMYDASAIPSPKEEFARRLEKDEAIEETNQQLSMV